MSNEKIMTAENVKRIFYSCAAILLTVIWIMIIFGFSSTKGEKSASQSQSITENVVKIINPDYKMPEKVEPKSKDSFYDSITRKVAHVCVYAVLGGLMYVVAKTSMKLRGNLYYGSLSALLCVLVSLCDEYNQTLTEGRTGRLTDVLIDSVGIIIGTYLCMKFMEKIITARKTKIKE